MHGMDQAGPVPQLLMTLRRLLRPPRVVGSAVRVLLTCLLDGADEEQRLLYGVCLQEQKEKARRSGAKLSGAFSSGPNVHGRKARQCGRCTPE